jgi:HK97 family phage prohead protease
MFKKTLNLDAVDMKLDGDTGRFSGYASVFGGVDSYGDTIVRGAYASTLRNNGKPKMFFNHNAYGLPIGKWIKATEDDHGLFVEGELTMGNRQAEDVHAALKHGTLDGLSIGYYLKKGDYDETESGRVIKKVASLVEVSVVTFPADSAARVDSTSVKCDDSMIEAVNDIETVREFERFLRDAGGLSKGLTMALVSRAKTIFVQGEPVTTAEAKAIEEVLGRIKALNLISAPSI